MSKRESSSEIDEAAANWALRIDDAVLGKDEQRAFETWLGGDVRRVGAFARAQAVLVHAKRAKALGAEFEPEAFARAEQATAEPIVDDGLAPPGRTRRRILIGASAVAAAGAFAFVLPVGRASARVFETARGETRLLPLDDGSTVTLNTDSSIAVTTDATLRKVELVRGEALFKVAGAGRPPFLVEAGGASLRAEAAVFSVCRLPSRPLQIEVCEGRVDVAPDGPAAGRPRRLEANVTALVASDGTMTERSVAPEALSRELAWQQGMLSFEDTPLSEAAAEFARYSDRRIRIADAAVGSETVTGLYAANNPEGFARAVGLGLNLRVQATPGGIIIAR